MLGLLAATCSFNAPTTMVGQSAVTTVGRQLAARGPAVLVMCAEPEDDVPELIMPPSRPAAMMTESERRRAEPVHDLKHKRKAKKLRDDEGDLVGKEAEKNYLVLCTVLCSSCLPPCAEDRAHTVVCGRMRWTLQDLRNVCESDVVELVR